jgi:FkbM family methyltransferase
MSPYCSRKPSRLTLAAVLTGVVSFLYLYLFENQRLYRLHRCLKAAPRWHYCYESKLRDFDFTTEFYGMRYEGNTKNGIDREVLFLGAYEKHILFLLRDVLERISPNRSGVFIDVGANSGQHSLFMSRYAKEVHSFEPYEPVLERFRRMMEINRIQNIRIYPVGLGDRDAKVPFFAPPESNQGKGSFVKGFDDENTGYKELQVVVGDQALKKAAVGRVDLMKIDVEGFEKLVLHGLHHTLTASRPVVDFELTIDPSQAITFKSMEDILSVFPKGYEFSVIDPASDLFTGSYRLIEVNEKVNFNFAVVGRFDVVAYPAERKGQIPRGSP